MSRRSALIVGLALVLVFAACGTDDTTQPPTTQPSTSQPATTQPATTATTTTTTTATSTTATPTTSSTTTTTSTSTTTTTEPPDVTPPELVITAPQPGETVTTGTYRFAGTTEPGCTVTAAGRYPADVDAEGNWSIILVLNEGGNLATFVAADEAGNTTTARIAVYYERPARNSDYYSLAGNTPTRYPDTPLAIAFVDLEDGADELVAEFGPPDQGSIPDEGRWHLGDESWIAWNAVEETALSARVRPLGEARLALFNEIVLGSSTVADLIAKWGVPLHLDSGDSCPPYVEPLVECQWMNYTHYVHEIRFFWQADVEPASDWILEGVLIDGYWWGMYFIDNGAVGLGNITELCDERGCRVHSDSTWTHRDGVTPFYSWGADCLDDACDYVAIFIGTAPPDSVPNAEHWGVQTSHAIGGLLLAEVVPDRRYGVIGSAFAGQSSDRPLLGPVQDPDVSDIYRYRETTDRDRYEAWEIDLDALTITRLACDGPSPADCRPVWE